MYRAESGPNFYQANPAEASGLARESMDQYRAKLRELAAPTPDLAATFEDALVAAEAAAGTDDSLSPQERLDVRGIVAARRWMAALNPGEPAPPALLMYTIEKPACRWRAEISHKAKDYVSRYAADAIRAIEHDVKSRTPEIEGVLRAVIQASPGYQLFSTLNARGQAKDGGPAFWRHAQIAEAIQKGFGLNERQLRSNPAAHHYHRRETARAEQYNDHINNAPATVSNAARNFIVSELSALYRQTNGKDMPDDILTADYSYTTDNDKYHKKMALIDQYAAAVNGPEGTPAAIDFTTTVIYDALTPDFNLAQSVANRLEWTAEISAGDFRRQFHDLGVNETLFWLRELEAPGTHRDVAPVNLGQAPGTYEEFDAAEKMTAGIVLIDKRPGDEISPGRLIMDETSVNINLPSPAEGDDPDLRINLLPIDVFGMLFDASTPRIADYTTTAMTVEADGSRTYDFVLDKSKPSLYEFCADPLSDSQRQNLIEHFTFLGATKMVKYLEAYPKLRIGDVSDLLSRSSKAFYRKEGETAQWYVDTEGLINIQCVSMIRILHDSLIAAGIPLVSLRPVEGLLLREKNGIITKVGHADLEYTSPSGQKHLLNPLSIDRDQIQEQNQESSSSRGLLDNLRFFIRAQREMIRREPPTNAAIGRASLDGIKVDPAEAPIVSADSNTTEAKLEPETTEPATPTTSPESIPSLPASHFLYSALEIFERQIATAFSLGSENKPATSSQVWAHMQANCRHGDIVAMTATLFDSSRDLTVSQEAITPSAIKAQLEEIDKVSETINLVLKTPALRKPSGGYAANVLNALMHSANTLRSAYEATLASVNNQR